VLVLPTSTTHAPAPRATAVSGVSVCVLGVLYLWRGLAIRHPVAGQSEAGLTTWFGVDRWAFVGQGWAITFASLAVAAGLAVVRWPERAQAVAADAAAALGRQTTRLIVAVVSVELFCLFSDRTENLDGSLLQGRFEASPGGFATHDEMLELFLHSRLWAGLHALWGWDVAQTYRLVSCLAGGVAVLVALRLAHRFDQPLVVLGLLAGGAGGDGVLRRRRELHAHGRRRFGIPGRCSEVPRRRGRLALAARPAAGARGAVPSRDAGARAVAAGPGRVVAVRRGRRLDGALTLAVLPAVLSLGLWWLDEHGLPIAQLVSGSQISAQGGDWSRFLFRDGATGWWLQLQLVLLAPAAVLLPACRFAACGASSSASRRRERC
jgi:hypothetical protein